MMTSLEQIRREGQAHKEATIVRKCREGSEIKGHWRHYKDCSVWIEAHNRVAHTVRRIK